MARRDQTSSTIDRQGDSPADEPVERHDRPPAAYIRVGKRGQIVIPAAIRRELGIEDGSELWVRADEEGQIVLEAVSSDPWQRFIDVGRKVFEGVDTAAYIRSLRDEWED